MANVGAITLTAIEAIGLVALENFVGGSVQRKLFWDVEAAEGETETKELFPQVVIEESHHDELIITDHPVERGAVISDHAFKRPADVSIRAGWSDASQFDNPSASGLGSLLNTAITGFIPRFGDKDYLRDLYDTLLSLQADRTLISLVTGKRSYDSMLLQSISLHTDERTEHTLLVHMRFRQIILVRTQTVPLPPAAQHKSPQKTAPTIDRGSVQTKSGSLYGGSNAQ